MYRIINLFIVLLIVAAMSFALYFLEGVLHLDPCPLCVVDRAILIGIAIVCFVALLHNAQGIARWIYSTAAALLSILGIAVSARHIWLQGLPPDQVPECGPDLAYMLDVFPLDDVIKRVFTGSGSCAEVSWTMLGLSIPQQTLFLFIFLLLLVFIAHRSR